LGVKAKSSGSLHGIFEILKRQVQSLFHVLGVAARMPELWMALLLGERLVHGALISDAAREMIYLNQ